jgi:hypothetical protein
MIVFGLSINSLNGTRTPCKALYTVEDNLQRTTVESTTGTSKNGCYEMNGAEMLHSMKDNILPSTPGSRIPRDLVYTK